MLVVVSLAAFIGVIGGVILAGALRHIRTPTRNNARDLASTTAVLLWMFGTAPLWGYIEKGSGSSGRAIEMLPFLAAIGIPYLLYRFVLKKMAVAAFPDETVPKGDPVMSKG
jgi:hypothetical protein